MTEAFFLPNLVLFTRLLHELGLPVSPEQDADLARILAQLDLSRRQDVYNAARSILVRRHADYPTFERAFNLFFAIQGKPQQSVISPTQSPVARRLRPVTIQNLAERESKKQADQGDRPEPKAEEVPLYSDAEQLRQKRFEDFSEEELRAARHLIAQLDWRVGLRRTRRYRRNVGGTRLDLSRVLRHNLKHGAEVYALPARARVLKPRPLIILADISGSMERYSRLVLQLVHALGYAALASRVEVFVFSTQLTRITPDLKRRSLDSALARVTARVPDFGGGTRIGDAIKTFNYKWARRVMHNGPVVMIISDGWDRGDLTVLRDEMARLQRSSSRLIWLNPLLGNPAFQAEAQGLQVALPFVDEHLPIHNLASLEQLVALLGTIGTARPLRRQSPHVTIPTSVAATQKFMDLPEMGTSDYIRRTLVMRIENGVPTFSYQENPDE